MQMVGDYSDIALLSYYKSIPVYIVLQYALPVLKHRTNTYVCLCLNNNIKRRLHQRHLTLRAT